MEKRCTLSGKLSCNGGLVGKLSVAVRKEYEHETYTGSYEVVPDVLQAQVLPTANKTLSEDIVIKEIPYRETGNIAGGATVYIGKEVV